MTTTDPQIAAWLDQMDQLVAKNIRTNGVHLEHVLGEPDTERGQLVAGELIIFANWPHRLMVEASPNPGEIVFGANRHYQRPDEASVPVLQLTTDDAAGLFPWDDGYSIPAWVQPRPGTFKA